jgi:spermidine synthase
MARKGPHASVVRKAVLLLFFISGAAGLIYEVTWTRAFGLVFGNTVFAVSTVLAAFMLGLALGSWLFGRIADRSHRPLRLYAILEVGVGAYAFFFPKILAMTDLVYLWFFRSFAPGFYTLSLLRFILSVILLLLPTVLMGGTLPVLSRLWAYSSPKKVSQRRIGQSVGLLYAINTFGAVVGSFLAGYVLIRIVGVSNTVYLASSANVVVGFLAFILSRFFEHKADAVPAAASARRSHGRDKKRHTRPKPAHVAPEAANVQPTADNLPAGSRWIVLAAVGVSGFCALALEVLWTRLLLFVLGTSAYAFACMLTCFILGLALGSFLCSRLLLPRIRNPILALGVVQFLLALSVLASVRLLALLWRIDYVVMSKLAARGFWGETAVHFGDALAVLLIPTVLMGFVFPIAVEAFTSSWKAVGRGVGRVYACNTTGCVIGSFVAGFVMVPLLGLPRSFVLVLACQLLLAALLVLSSERRRPAPRITAVAASLMVLVAAVLLLPQDLFLSTMNTYHYPSRIVYIRDDATGTITVHDLPDGDRLIAVDGVDVAGMDLMLRTTQKLQGYVPLLVHANPRKVIQIGYGSGETSGVGLAFGVEDYRIVEVCPGVFEAGKFFEEINKGSYKDPRLKRIIMDGKNFAKLTDEKFDIIMNDSTYPGTTGSSALYTYDHFLQCRERLRPGGVQSCWLPLDLRPDDFRLILRSFQAAMPHCSLWMANNCLNKHAVLVGTMSQMQIDFRRVKKLMQRPDISSDLAAININSIYDLLDCFVLDEHAIRNISGPGPLNTDDMPSLEFGAAIKRDEDTCLMTALTWISQNHSPVSRSVVNIGDDPGESEQVAATLQQFFNGTESALRGLLGIVQGDPEIMNHEFQMTLKANPLDRDVNSCLDEVKTELAALVVAVERTPYNATLQGRLAKRYMLLQDYGRAAEQYLVFVKLRPQSAPGWNNLGICYKRLERFAESVEAFEKAVECDGDLLSAHFNLGQVHLNLGNSAAAVQTFQNALALSSGPYKAYAYDKLAQAYLDLKQYDRSLSMLEKAMQTVPEGSAFYEDLQRQKETVHAAMENAQP